VAPGRGSFIRPADLPQLEVSLPGPNLSPGFGGNRGHHLRPDDLHHRIEGVTAAIMFPFSIIAAITALILGWGKFKRMPVLSCFTVGYTLAALVYLGWGLYWGGFPQFSHLGWI
jgi:hypothetical protein